jgi:hypothetical protein
MHLQIITLQNFEMWVSVKHVSVDRQVVQESPPDLL